MGNFHKLLAGFWEQKIIRTHFDIFILASLHNFAYLLILLFLKHFFSITKKPMNLQLYQYFWTSQRKRVRQRRTVMRSRQLERGFSKTCGWILQFNDDLSQKLVKNAIRAETLNLKIPTYQVLSIISLV